MAKRFIHPIAEFMPASHFVCEISRFNYYVHAAYRKARAGSE
jgi:hypothetical protein